MAGLTLAMIVWCLIGAYRAGKAHERLVRELAPSWADDADIAAVTGIVRASTEHDVMTNLLRPEYETMLGLLALGFSTLWNLLAWPAKEPSVLSYLAPKVRWAWKLRESHVMVDDAGESDEPLQR